MAVGVLVQKCKTTKTMKKRMPKKRQGGGTPGPANCNDIGPLTIMDGRKKREFDIAKGGADPQAAIDAAFREILLEAKNDRNTRVPAVPRCAASTGTCGSTRRCATETAVTEKQIKVSRGLTTRPGGVKGFVWIARYQGTIEHFCRCR